MRSIGNDVYIQRGEDFTLDLLIRNAQDDPYMIFKGWQNPYLAITVTAARYEQPGDFRVTYWLDLNERWVEQADGTLVQEPVKRFIETKAYPLSVFSARDAIEAYGPDNGGRVQMYPGGDYDVTNFLFFTVADDGKKTYKYVKEYSIISGQIYSEVWEDYDFRILKSFKTKNWTEQRYLYDAKILAGQSVQEFVKNTLLEQGISTNELPWSDEYLARQIERITNSGNRLDAAWAYAHGMPLMPDYDTKTLVLEPRNLFVSANIQGGVK